MAVCNGEKYLKIQLDSILQQLSANDELVISYDVSKDGTWALIDEYQAKDTRVRVYRNQHQGIVANFNNALNHCDGEYIFISDQDDEWKPNKRERVMQEFMETGADMVIHNGVHTNEALVPIGESFFSMYRIGNGKIRNIIGSRVSGCCMAFTQEICQRVLPIPQNIDGYGYDRWIGAVGEFTGKISYISDILLLHRLHDENATSKTLRPFAIKVKDRAILLHHLVKRLNRERINKR